MRRTYSVIITGETPLLMHHDNIEWSDYMDEWKNNPENKKISKAGDDRTPAWRWIGCCYHNKEVLAIPQANIMRAIMEGGAMVPLPGAKNNKTFKAQTQSGMMCIESFWPLITVHGDTIPWPDIYAMQTENSFSETRKMIQALGFDLLIKRAKIGQAKHVRVRPEFDSGWVIKGSIMVWDDQITTKSLEDILECAGQYKGLGDWRPGGKTPGPYGRFTSMIEQIG
jgi:hypothetical protein